ncbi:MAG: D-sedoheptulose 7-phosphate isomerase [bacterium]|nr:D-sedoheptulose 7-phosphate isomerase [bacterium]
MKYNDLINSHLSTSAEVKNSMIEQCIEVIEKISVLAADIYKKDGKILLCGNGGSAADSQHIATELIVRLNSRMDRKALPAMALTTNTSTLTAAGNDYGFDSIFARQVEAFGKSGDLLVGISTSGQSANIIKAVKTAAELDIRTVGFLGGDGGKLKDLVDLALIIPHTDTGRIQEGHITAGHIFCDIIERELFT